MSNFLLVDDDPGLLQSLSAAIHLWFDDARVDVADSVPVALLLIAQNRYDAIITDLVMPGVYGLELLRAMKSRQPETPILILSGDVTDGIEAAVYQLGAFAYFTKPVNRHDLLKAIVSAVRREQNGAWANSVRG